MVNKIERLKRKKPTRACFSTGNTTYGPEFDLWDNNRKAWSLN